MRHNMILPEHIRRMLDSPRAGDRVLDLVLREVRPDAVIAERDGLEGTLTISRHRWSTYVGTYVPA